MCDNGKLLKEAIELLETLNDNANFFHSSIEFNWNIDGEEIENKLKTIIYKYHERN